MEKLIYANEKEYHIKLKKGDVGRYVILPGDPGRCEKIAKYLDDAKFVASNREYVTYTGYLLGEKVSVVSTGIGGPSASIALEELIHIGADTFIRVGTAGGINEEVMSGDLVIATGAVRQEGTTREYAPIEFPAISDFTVTGALKESAEELGLKHHIGIVQSKDSFYGQHSPQSMPTKTELDYKWNAWLKCGVLASEMENASLFVVGAIRGVRVGSVLTVMGNQIRREKGLKENVCFDSEKAIETAVLAIKKIITKENNL